MPADMLKTLPGYDPDLRSSRVQARKIMEKLGYGPGKRLGITVSTRNIAGYHDPAVILIDQLKEIYFDAQLDTLDTTQWYPKIMRKDYKVGLNVTETAVDDPDPVFYENYVCGAQRNYTGYCNPEVDKMVDAQSMESDAQAQADGMGDRKEAGGGRCQADYLLSARRTLLATPAQGDDGDGQQCLQRTSLRGPLARQFAAGGIRPRQRETIRHEAGPSRAPGDRRANWRATVVRSSSGDPPDNLPVTAGEGANRQ